MYGFVTNFGKLSNNAKIIILKTNGKFPAYRVLKMKKTLFIKFLFLLCVLLSANHQIFAQTDKKNQIKSQEVSEEDGIPVLIKHLPEWENVRNSAILTHNVEDLKKSLGERPIFDLIDFAGGTEAVTAPYAQGKILIVEYTNPQSSIEMDAKTVQRLAEIGQTQQIFYRRIGNYNTFVFDAPDESAANSLLDQIKYEKQVQWLGDDPYMLKRAERAVVHTLSTLFVSTVLVIVIGIGIAILGGIAVGFLYFRISAQRRAGMEAFSDAGGMTRLNLDELTPKV
jgi:muconolactone delta-isomerase